MGDVKRMWHRIVNGVWKWSGMRAWHRAVNRQLRRPRGGDIPKEWEE